jgi:actin related protein 2/3 complex, subunit 3
MKNLATKQFLCPGDAGFPLGGLFPAPKNKAEGDQFRAYFKQARDELGLRLMDKLFNPDGTKNKWWQAFSKRRFMGKELKD